MPPPAPPTVFLELLAERKESEAGQFAWDELANGRLLRSLYLDVFAGTIEEAARRRVAGRLTVPQETFVGEATERIISSFAPLLFQAQGDPVCGAALCASFGTGTAVGSAGAVAAVLSMDGYQTCDAGVEPSYQDLAYMVGELNPTLCLFSLNAPNGWKSLERVLKGLASCPKHSAAYVIVALPEATVAPTQAGADAWVANATHAIDIAHARAAGLVARRAGLAHEA